jgi:thiol-disulfide isomerase/thioredoxin
MMNMRNILIKPVFFPLIMTVLLFTACSKASTSAKTSLLMASDFTLEALDGKNIVLSDVLKTKKAVLLFWTTWCPACRMAMPQVKRLYLEDKAAVIGIDVAESKAKVANFVRKSAIPYPIGLDRDGRIAKLYNVVGVPTIVAMGEDGKVIYYGHSVEEMMGQIDF